MAKKHPRSKEPPRRLEPPDRQTHSHAELFLSLSVALTGFDRAELQSTGMVDTYQATVLSVVGDDAFGDLLTAWHEILHHSEKKQDEELHKLLKDDPYLGPVAQNLGYLWYTGSWQQLPWAWRNAHGAQATDVSRIVSKEAYVEGLVWRAMGTHPQGAKQPGFGSWAMKPEV